MTTTDRIREFIERYVLGEAFTGEDPLAELELDSLNIEQLVDFLEEEYGVIFSDEEVNRENFSSVTTLAAIVDAKRRGRLPATGA